MEKKTVLVVADQQQRLIEQIVLADELRDEFNFYFVLDEKIPPSYFWTVSEKGYLVCYLFKCAPKNNDDASQQKVPPSFQKRRLSKLRSLSLVQGLQYLRCRRKISTIYERVVGILVDVSPALILINGDRGPVGLEQAFLKASGEKGIPSVVPYTSYVSDGLKIREGRKEFRLRHRSPLFDRFVFQKFKSQKFLDGDSSLYFYPASEMLALHNFGTLSAFPWMIGNGHSDIVCVDSEHNLERCIKYRVPLEKLVITGDVSFDSLYKTYKRKSEIKSSLISKYELNPDKKIIVVALPQLGEHKLCDWDTHWSEIDFLMGKVSDVGVNVLISLHPKMEYENYRFLEVKHSARLLDERLFQVLPCCDVFVATFSSTVIWAVLCGVNSLVVDFYGFNYNIFDFLRSPVVVRDRQILEKTLEKALNNTQDFSADWQSLSRDIVFDGKTFERYKQLFRKLVQ